MSKIGKKPLISAIIGIAIAFFTIICCGLLVPLGLFTAAAFLHQWRLPLIILGIATAVISIFFLLKGKKIICICKVLDIIRKRKKIAGILLALLFVSLGLFLSYKAKPTPINVNLSSHEAYSMLKTIEDVVLVDVREKTERDVEHIDDFAWVPYSYLKADHPEDWVKIEGIVKAHNRAIIYCASGKRSFEIVSRLSEKGYSNVYNLAGGIAEWKQKYPVIKAEEIKPEEKIEPEEQKIINITPPLEIEDFYTDKKVYYSNEIMTLTLKINSSSRIENVRIRTYGILDKWGNYRLNIEQKTNLTSGTNMLDFSYLTPSCYGCVGINPGTYELISSITYDEISVNKTTSIEIKP